MPLVTRSVSPVDLCLHRLPPSIQQDELQCVTNGTLANLIRQLSSLSRHAEQIFSEIHRELLKIDHRSSTLFLRVERLSLKLSNSQGGSNNSNRVVDQVGLEEASMRKAFKSCNIIDQHSLDRQTLPQPLLEEYQNCDAPPQLNQLNPYREDEKEALRYYTDPSYFFELWRNEILKECDGGLAEKKRTGRSSTSPSRQRRRQPHFPQQNNLFAHHVSSRSTDYSRFAPQIGHQNGKTLQHRLRHGFGPGHFSAASVAAEVLHFPAEYQTPQNLMMGGRIAQHPPPGMSMVSTNDGAVSQLKQQQQISSNEQTSVNLHSIHSVNNSHQFRMKEQNINEKIGAKPPTHQTNGAGKNDAAHALTSGLDVMFLDDDDDELPPPPPQNVLSSTVNPRSVPRIASSASSSSPHGSTNSPAALTNEPSKYNVEINKFEFISANGSSELEAEQIPTHCEQQRQPAADVTDNGQQPNQFHSIQQIPPSACTASAPPPPPPPPPPPNFSLKIGNEGTRTFGGQTGEGQQKDLQRKTSGTTQDNRSLLLMQIQEGVKLRKVRHEEELAEKRAVATSNDVAAILRKRMEHCLGDSDSSSGGSPSPGDNEWDD